MCYNKLKDLNAFWLFCSELSFSFTSSVLLYPALSTFTAINAKVGGQRDFI